MTPKNNTIVAEWLGDFFKSHRKKGIIVLKRKDAIVLKNPGRALETGANHGTAFASRSPNTTLLSLPELISFYENGKKSSQK